MQIKRPYTAVYITWEELFDERPSETEILDVIRAFNRQSCIAFLARLMALVFLDRAFRDRSETIKLQSFLIVNFWNDEILDRAKQRMGTAQLDCRIAFHPQQVLMMLKWVIVHSLPEGGIQPDTDEARFTLGRALLMTNDLLLSADMRAQIAQDRKEPSVKSLLRLQLSVGAGNEVGNPPPVINGVARSAVMFEELLQTIKMPVDLSQALERSAGLSLDAYVDLTLGALVNYIGRTPKEMIDDPNIPVVNPSTFFGSFVSPELTEKFWQLETTTMDELAAALSVPSATALHQDFTAFRMKPFVRLETGNLVCVNPGFVQEKLEVGLFWAIANGLEGKERQDAFDTWGRLFEAYVNQTLETAVDPAVERYVPHPDFVGKSHHHESFDGILVSGHLCAVFECKGGFIPNNAKYADDVGLFVKNLDKKFGTEKGAGVEQLARKIGQIFAKNPKVRRTVEGVDLSAVNLVIPVLVVQDNFASSLLTVPWLVKSFRDLMRKVELDTKVVWPSLLVLHIEDVEKLSVYVRSRSVSLNECLLAGSKMGDPRPGRLFSFDQILRAYLVDLKIEKKPPDPLTKKFDETINRVTMRFFNQPFKPIRENL